MRETPDPAQRLVLVTGPSGAGRSTALAALEDLGFEAIDNFPLSLFEALLAEVRDDPRPLALSLDARNRDFNPERMAEVVTELSGRRELSVDLVYLDCDQDVLLRRFSETRRKHPLAPMDAPEQGIKRELAVLGPVREAATHLIDTSKLTPHQLGADMARWFSLSETTRLALSVLSFSYKKGVPHGADIVFDCRFLRNPHWDPALRPLTGLDAGVASYVAADPRYGEFRERILGLISFQLPASLDEGKAHLTVAFGCTGGRHRSVTLAETVANGLGALGWHVAVRHRELERLGLADPVQPESAA